MNTRDRLVSGAVVALLGAVPAHAYGGPRCQASDARPVGVVTVAVGGGESLSSDAPGATPRGPETDRARAAADEMVILLTEQVREQESQLRRTEARLERAKALLRSLGGFVPDPQVIPFLTEPRRVTPPGPKVPYRTPPRLTIPYTQ